MLYGMAEPIRASLVKLGERVRVYAPIGELLPGMAYLVRRLLENTSNESFLRKGFAEGVSHEQLLAAPSSNGTVVYARPVGAFLNEPHADFSLKANRDAIVSAL